MRSHRTQLAALLAGALMLAVLACEDSETVAPDGATIVLAATPATILLSGGTQVGDVNILATVRNSIGVPLPGQDVRFTQTSGVLTPKAGTPVETDDLGNALTVLTLATQNTTITAQSGKATAMLSLQSTTCNISSVAVSRSQISFIDCDDEFELIATVTSTGNQPCVGVLVVFSSTVDAADLPDTDVSLTFTPGSDTTDMSGQATTIVGLDEDCSSKCRPNLDCNTSDQQIIATAGSTDSPPVDVSDDIP